MALDKDAIVAILAGVVARAGNRTEALKTVASEVRRAGGFRWVGLYDVDRALGVVVNLVWDGPAPPENPVFAIGAGLTGVAIAEQRTVNVGDVAAEPRYLIALDSTRSEMIVPILGDLIPGNCCVAGTLDVESSEFDAFPAEVQAALEACAETIRPLWR